jgi:hypothetical protein
VIRLRNLRALLAVLIGGLVVGGCVSDDRDELRGSLYFAAGKYLAALDLRDGSTSVVSNLGDAEILSLGPQLDDRLLLNVIAVENQRSMHQLMLYDIGTRQRLTLLNGRSGRYLPGTKVLVFDDGVRTWITERKRGNWEKTEVVQHRYGADVDVMPITATRFIYRVADGPLFVFDRTASRSIQLVGLDLLCPFDRALWMAGREQMLCRVRRDDGTFEYSFVGLDGTRHESLPLPGDRDLRPLAYLPDQDILVLTERWQGAISDRWKWGVWVYHFDSEEIYRLLDDQYLGDTVVYSTGYHG